MKLKSLMALAIALLCSAGAWAQTDVFKDITTEKITDPSFEATGATVAEKSATGDLTTGWKITAINYARIAIFDNDDVPASNTYGASSPSEGSYYLMVRSNLTDNTKTQNIQQQNAFSLPFGTYKIKYDYKAAKCSGYDMFFTISAKDGSTDKGSKKITIEKKSKNTSYFSGIDWTTADFDFSLTETKDITLDISCQTRGVTEGHTVILLDNFILEWNLTQSLTNLLEEANNFYTAEGDSYTALKAVIDATDPSDTDAGALETQYNALDAALKLAQARKDWLTAYNTLDELDEDALPGAAKTAITDALGASEPTTIEGYNTAKAALQALIDNYAGIKAAYDKVNALILLATNEKDYSAGDADEKSTLNEAINTANTNKETRTTADDLNGDYTTLETARQTYVISGAEPAAGYPFEVTFKIVNPSFENDKKETSAPAGWIIPNKGNQYGAKAKGSMSNVEGNYYFNNWQSWWMDCNVEQTISSLPNGRYEVTAVLASYSGTSANLQAGSGSTDTNMTGENNGIRVSVNGDVTSSSLTIRARAGRKNDGSLLRADDFTLSFIGLKPVLSDLITSATALTTTNVGDGAFQIPSSAASTLSDAIDTAQDVYNDDSAYGSTIQDAIDELNGAIETFQSSELNAPAEGDVFNVMITTNDNYGFKDKPLTFNSDNVSGANFYKAYGVTPYRAQQITFTKVSGNQYTLSMVNAEGNRVYIRTNAPGKGGDGNTSQIRLTTVPENALAVEVIPSKTTNGVYTLKNTEANALLGCQDADSNPSGGLYTVGSHNNFTITAASKPSVPVAVNSGKWSTRIFPFAVAEVPDGLEVYTATGISGASIVMSDALSSIPANTPVLIKATTDVDVTLQGYGTATADSYKDAAELLTGFYTAKTIDAGNYVLQTQGGVQAFYRLAENATANQVYRAYLTVPDAGDVKAFYFDFNDATAIAKIQDSGSKIQDSEIYNLAGQRLNKAQKGVNIINGKKVLVK